MPRSAVASSHVRAHQSVREEQCFRCCAYPCAAAHAARLAHAPMLRYKRALPALTRRASSASSAGRALPCCMRRRRPPRARCAASPSRTPCTRSCEQLAQRVRARYALLPSHRAPADVPRCWQLTESARPSVTPPLPLALLLLCCVTSRTAGAPGSCAPSQARSSGRAGARTRSLRARTPRSPPAASRAAAYTRLARHRPCGASHVCLPACLRALRPTTRHEASWPHRLLALRAVHVPPSRVTSSHARRASLTLFSRLARRQVQQWPPRPW
jgi:hypothetical protein